MNNKSKNIHHGRPIVAHEERENNDYYATNPKAVKMLLELEEFNHLIWEPACGEGHISKVLKEYGYKVISSDLIDRGYGKAGVDFLKFNKKFPGDIITNPPYKYAYDFIVKALELVEKGSRIAYFLPIGCISGIKRGELYKENPPQVIYAARRRIACAKNGDFEKYGETGAVDYAWFIWKKGYKGITQLKWFN